MHELDFVADSVEEQIVRGNLRWLANFNEIRRNHVIGDLVFPVYASGGLQEKGFFLSRIFSALVTPKYRVHLLLYTSQKVDAKLLRKLILTLKNNFDKEEWILLSIVQSQPLANDVRNAIAELDERNIGVVAFSLSAKEEVSSQNVLGKGLLRQLKLTEAKFEAFDLPNYLKSFTIALFLGVLFLSFLAIIGFPQAVNPITLLLIVAFSLVAGHKIYKTRYHVTLTLSSSGFQLREGQRLVEGKWSNYDDAIIYITPKRETCIRLYSHKESVDLPISRTGLSRKEMYQAITRLMKGGNAEH
ncbi:MAG: hypothetical protein N3F10_02630 [Candidatus Bathyarchaeota archaeon]|nr:hypothetical protein [Candidatus Bathyarchaeota archaeon]